MLFGLFGHRFDDATFALYRAIVTEARHPEFYLHYGVPDTVTARFDMIVFHMAVLLHRLQREPEVRVEGRNARRTVSVRERGQDLIDLFFTEMDRALREMGIGDLGVPKRMKKLAAAWNGRFQAYAAAIEDDDRDALAAAIGRNILLSSADVTHAAALADHALVVAAALAEQPIATVAAGNSRWPAPPVFESRPAAEPPAP